MVMMVVVVMAFVPHVAQHVHLMVVVVVVVMVVVVVVWWWWWRGDGGDMFLRSNSTLLNISTC